jgi:CheY-like chemotaxis protein
LLVDDDPGVRSSLRRLLSAQYQVAVADGVDQALAAVAAQPFDVLLVDVMMPDGGGERLYRSVSAADPALATRVVFCTGAVLDPVARGFLSQQPQPVLEKPLDVAAFGRTADRLAGPSAGHA